MLEPRLNRPQFCGCSVLRVRLFCGARSALASKHLQIFTPTLHMASRTMMLVRMPWRGAASDRYAIPCFIAHSTFSVNTSTSDGVVYTFGVTRIPMNSFSITIGVVTMLCLE